MSSSGRAVVIGGSVAGLFAAAALTEQFDEVIVIDRDEIPEGPRPRQGVPQGKHVHVTMPIGYNRAEELLPGLHARTASAGAVSVDFGRDFALWGPAGWNARGTGGLPFTSFTRPLFEWAVRSVLSERPQVELRQGAVTGLLASDDRSRVTGVTLAGGASPILADLVVDASGRGSKGVNWLGELGYAAPAEQHLRAYVGYTSALIRIPDGVLPEGILGLTALPYAPAHVRGAGMLPVEDGQHILTSVGVTRDYPPTDREGFLAFLKDAPSPLISEVVEASEFVTEPAAYLIPGNRRRVWEGLERRPEAFVVVGDAVGMFNPTYGQGMTQAILAADTLREELRSRNGEIDGLAGAFHEKLGPISAAAFAQAAGGDCFYPGAEAENYEPPNPEEFAIFADLGGLATQDAEVADAFFRMAFFMDYETIMSERIQGKVQAWIADGRPMLRNTDPSVFPEIVEVDAAA